MSDLDWVDIGSHVLVAILITGGAAVIWSLTGGWFFWMMGYLLCLGTGALFIHREMRQYQEKYHERNDFSKWSLQKKLEAGLPAGLLIIAYPVATLVLM